MSQLDKLAGCRRAILLAEVGAWLHLAHKYDWGFVRQHREDKTGDRFNYGRPDFLNKVKQYPNLNKLLSYGSEEYAEILKELKPLSTPVSLGIFIRDHDEGERARTGELDNLTTLMHEGHGRGSHIDKEDLANVETKQVLNETHTETAFGYETRLQEGSYRPAEFLNALEELAGRLAEVVKSSDVEPWHTLLRNLKEVMRQFGQSVPAETRVPFHDVSLFDQTSSAVAFFKAALAERVVAGGWKPLVENYVPQYAWRSLSITVDGLQYLEATRGIGDLLGRKERLRKAQDAAARIVEVQYPLGSEIYRDEHRVVFVVPDDPNLLAWADSGAATLADRLGKEFAAATDGELRPHPRGALLKTGTRTVYKIAEQLSATLALNSADVDSVRNSWEGRTGTELCSNCQLRPLGAETAASTLKLCDSCFKRRERRAREWWDASAQGTVWLDEATDRNGRIALIVGRWDLDPWLDGTAWSSVVAAPDAVLRKLADTDFEALERACATDDGFTGVLQKLIRGDIQKDFGDSFSSYYDNMIRPEWQGCDEEKPPARETRAAIYLVRQNPSFSRMRRTWETTRKFWQEVLPTDESRDLPTSALGLQIPSTYARLELRGDMQLEAEAEDDPQRFLAYQLLTDGQACNVVWVPRDGDHHFVTVDNLDHLKNQVGQDAGSWMRGRKAEILRPTGYGSPNKHVGWLHIRATELLEPVVPLIPILAEPRNFLAIVPAAEGIEAARTIFEKYQKEIGKVRNRLALQISLVYADVRAPLRSIVDAGRRMLNRSVKAEEWVVSGVPTQPFASQTEYALQLERNGKAIVWRVPAGMAGKEGGDSWYPYVFLAGPPSADGRKRSKGVWGTALRELLHVKELKAGDRILFTPSTFDFEWLDTAGRRFELAYDADGRRRGCSPRPYLLDELDCLEAIWDRLSDARTGLTNSQINALEQTIESKRDEWTATDGDDPFTLFCRHALLNADWGVHLDKAMELDAWTEHAAIGRLHDAIELHRKIMKEKSKRGGSVKEEEA